MKTKMRKSKMLSAVLALVMGVSMLPQTAFTSFAAAGDSFTVGNGRNQYKDVSDGFSYEVWIDTTGGTGTMTLGQGATFKAEWNASVPSGNFLARRGLDFGSQKKATDYEYIGLDYEADYRQTGSASGNSRLCVYGWFQNKNAGNVPLVEYYIIEDWVDWVPDAPGKIVTIDGAQYKIFQMEHSGPSINSSYETFKQYFSVRQDKRTSGHITVSDHFDAWAAEGWGIGNLYEVALNAEGWQSSGVADITKLNVYTDPSQAEGDVTPPATTEPEADVNYTAPSGSGNGVTDDFEGTGTDWTGRGEVSYGLTSDFAHGGSKSLYVEGRTQSWNGFTVASDELAAGGSYDISAFAGFKSSNYNSMGFTLGVQYDVSGTTEYVNLVDAEGTSGMWSELAASFDIPAGASNISLYVQSAYTENASASDLLPFYLDDVKLTKTGGTTSTTDPTENTNPSVPSSDSLKDAFASCFKLGTSVSPQELSVGGDFIKKHFNSITPENELKPEAIINQYACQQYGNNVNTQVDLSRAAQTLKFCEDNNIGVRGHTFVWYSQTPDWFFRENFSSDGAYVSTAVMDQRLESFIKNTFDAIKTQYPNLNLYAYDVCNELFLNNGGGMRGADNSGWMRVYGDDSFVIKAFQYARKYAPEGCKLYINDYNEYIPEKTNDIYNMAMKLKELGVIDGIGMQSHLDTGYPSAALYKTALEKFISTGLDVQITELDITCSDFNAQAQLYKDIFQMAVDNKDSISCLTVWGTNDSISWRKDQNPLLFSQGYVAKPAYDAVMEVAAALPTEDPTEPTTEPTTAPTTAPTTEPTTKPTTEPTSEPTAVKYGDANCDGSVSIVDVIQLNKSLLGTEKLTAQGEKNADVDENGALEPADSLNILKYLVDLVTSFPC
ncbi:MAG: endo-1,4-beta-xylanase [Oscillospiraceae bacterium]|nr:endo-1,4-beta-xylanase [Oscillospiraceae bacterium]